DSLCYIVSAMPFVWRTRIRFVDTDASRRIHYTAMFRHFEAAEHEFLIHIGFPYSQIASREVGFPRVHVEADFKDAIGYNDLRIPMLHCIGNALRLAYSHSFCRYRCIPAHPLHGDVSAL